MVTNEKKKMLGGSWLLLTLLMIGMSWSAAVAPVSDDVSATDAEDDSTTTEDYFALSVEETEAVSYAEFGYPDENELIGSRTATSKTYVTEEGKVALVTSDPIHYLDDGGVWQNIDTDIESTATGWTVAENNFVTEFSTDMNRGVTIQVDENVDPILMGLNPSVVTMDREQHMPMPYGLDETDLGIETGANVLRYPMGQGIALDYQVTATQVKQNLIVRDMPFLPEGFQGSFGLQEEMILPHGYAIFDGESPIRDGEQIKTNESITIRNVETGELLVTIPAPMITDSNITGGEPVFGEYLLVQMGEYVQITTLVDADWLTNETRTYPVVIDPTLDIMGQNSWYARRYSYRSYWGGSYTYYQAYGGSSLAYSCMGTGSSYTTCGYSSYTYFAMWPVHKFNMNNVVPTGASVNDPNCSSCGVKFQNHVGRYYSGSRNFEVSIMKTGTSQSSTMVDPSTQSSYYKAYRSWRSPSSSSSTSLSDPGYYYYGGNVRSISFNSNGVDDVQDAIDGNAAGSSGTIFGLIIRSVGNSPRWYWCGPSGPSYYGCTNNANKPHLEVTYTGGSDTTAPVATQTPFDGKTTYLEGARTMYITLEDASGIDTTTAGMPHIHYRVDSGSWNAVAASTIGTCVAGVPCNFKATIPGQTASTTGTKTVEYFWAYRDSPAPPNGGVSGTTGSSPAGATGMPSNINTYPSSPYSYDIEHIENAAVGDNKWQLQANGWNSYSYYSAVRYFSWQMTYYEPSREYHIEWDTSNCGTGTLSCFNSASILDLRYYPGTTRYTTSTTAQNNKETVTIPGMTMNARTGPGMDLVYWFDGAKWGVMGYEASSGTGIQQPLSDGDVYTNLDYGSNDDGFVIVDIPGDITGYFGSFSWNETYNLNSANRNKFCISTNNHPNMFVRSTRTYGSYNNPCISSFSYYRYQYAWNGFMLPGYDGKVDNGWSVYSKVTSILPTPDTFPPEFDHNGLMDTYVDSSRSLTFEIKDIGDPAMGLNTSSGTDSNGVLEGPHMKYRVYDNSTGTWSAWSTRSFSPSSGSRASCSMNTCEWTTSIPGTDRDNTVEYTIHAKDLNGNWNNSSTYSYDIETPTKIFVIEWHDMTSGSNQAYTVSYQVRLYDVTNEIEFTYDTGSSHYYDYEVIGYQDPSASIGNEIRGRGTGYQAGLNAFTNNYRIATDGNDHSYETYAAGMSELFNFNEEYTGSSNGWPYTYYCTRYFTSYRSDCSTVIDLPAGFSFDYFGNTYDGDQGHKIHAIRHGAMQFSTSSTTNSAQMMSSGWGTRMPTLPSSSSYAANVDLAPWFGYYSAYYCHYNTNNECSIRTKMIPFDGAGMDVNADITTPTIWDAEQSPIRVNPSNGDYLQVSADLTIEAGVEVQIAEGKGIVFTGACNKLDVNGNSTDPVTITNMGTNYAKGLAFTNGCTTSTTDRHTFEHTNFVNLSIAISAGSRHGSAPHYNGNVGDFTFSDVTFTNVDTAISHGSGQGTNFDMSNVDISNSADTCMVLPDDSTVTWIGGSATDCNTHATTGQGAVNTGSGSTVWIENVDFVDSAVNGVFGQADSLSLSNVTVDASSGFAWQQGGTAVAHTTTANSGTSLYAFNVTMANYVAALTTHATDSLHMERLASTGDSNGYWITPAGSSSPTVGDTGWTMDDVSADGGLTMARTQPSAMDNIDLGGALSLSGTAASTSLMSGDSISATGLTINGCGWNINFGGVDLGDGSQDAWVSANCGSTSTSNVVTISDGTIAGDSSNNNFVYARNSVLTVAEMAVTGQTNVGSYLASAGTNADIRLIGVNFRGNDCLDSSNSADTSSCWVEAQSGTAKVHFGGTATVYTYRSGTSGDVMKQNHKVTTAVHDGSGTELFSVGTGTTDSNGAASVWLITDLYEMDINGATSSSATYTDHTIRVAGGAGQNVTTPTDPWYTTGFAASIGSGYAGDLPLEVGETIYLKLEAYPMDFGGGTKDCTFFANNDSASTVGGYYTYTRQIITLSADMVLDGCSVHLEGTSLRMNRSANNNPTITLRNGAELLISEEDGDFGHIKAQSSQYPWSMNLEDGGTLTVDAGSIRDMDGGLAINAGTVSMLNGSTAYGSPNAALTTATLNVDGGTLLMNNAGVQNVNSGVGIRLKSTATSNLQNILVKNSEVGIEVINAAPAIDGYTLTDNTVGIDVSGGMSLPTIYRSTLLSGQSQGWTTYEIDITDMATDNNFLQVGVDMIYGGGNSDWRKGSYYSRYYMTTDRYRIAIDDGDGTGLNNITDSSVTGYYPWGSNDPAVLAGTHTYSGGVGGQPVWDCNLYGYEYNPGNSYRYGYYYYMINYGNGAYTSSGNYYGQDAYPNEFGFRWDVGSATANDVRYPYMWWGSYWPSFYHANTVFVPPEGFNGMWGSYNVCQNQAYYTTSNPAGAMMSYPIVDTSSSSIVEAKLYMDVVHYGADYYDDRAEFSVRTGNSVTALLGEDYSRDQGLASIDNGQITGAATGIRIGGDRAAAAFDTVTVTNPTSEGVYVDGTTGAEMAGLTVTDGRYGVRMGSAAGGKLVLDNVALDNQSQDGVVLSKDMTLSIASGTIENAAGAGLRVLSSNTGNWAFAGLTLDSNDVAVRHDGSGNMVLSNMDAMNSGTSDVEMSGSATIDWLEGNIDDTKIAAADSSKLTRLRNLDVDVTIGSTGTGVPEGSPVKILDSTNRLIDSGSTDANGEVNGMNFVTWTYDSSGKVTKNLAGYQLITIAKVAYSNGVTTDIRWAMDTISLADSTGNAASAALTQSIDKRICYGFTSTSYDLLAGSCSGLSSQGTRSVSNGQGGTVWEGGYYATPGSGTSSFNTAFENQTILIDTPYTYLRNQKTSFNNSIVFMTGTYNSDTRVYAQNVGGSYGTLHMDGVTMIAMGKDASTHGSSFTLGYSGTSNYGNYVVSDSTLIGFATIASGSGYGTYANNGVISVTDSTLVHHRTAVRSSTSQLADMCIRSSGFDGVTITGNDFIDCGVGVQIPSNYYAYNSYYVGTNGLIGAQNWVVSENTFEDTQNLGAWMYLNAYARNFEFSNNTITGTPPRYGVYTQDSTTDSAVITGNTIHADNPVYMRGSKSWEIADNTITGISDASRPCIYVLNGFGIIEGNTCTDADGGISVSGIRSGQIVRINDNTVQYTAGRLPTAALGIYLDSCGLDEVYMSNNDVSTVMNGLNTKGCTVTDNGSSYTAMPGRAAQSWNVDAQQSTFAPAHLTTVCVGDSVRWTSRAYNGGNPHTTTSYPTGQADSWDSGAMNLGSTFVHTFNTAGNFTYHSSSFQSMNGSVLVSVCNSNLVTTGIDVLGGSDDLILNGVTVTGYKRGLDMVGGDLHLASSTSIAGEAVAVAIEDVDFSTNGASLSADENFGIALSVSSANGQDDLDMTDLSVSGSIGVLADGHENLRWNGGVADADTVLKTVNGASGTIENMSGTFEVAPGVLMALPWSTTAGCSVALTSGCLGPTTQINAGAYSTITSIGNGVLNNGYMNPAAPTSPTNPTKLVVDSDAIIHEGNLLNLTVTHMGAAPSNPVGLFIRSVPDLARSEYVSPSWRTSAGRAITVDGNFYDWLGSNLLNDADDMAPGPVAVNATTGAHMRVTWDSSFLYIALIGPTFSLTDGMAYLDTGAGGSSTGDNWHAQHTLGFEADYMLWMEDLNNWGIRKVMPTGNWVDVTASCTGLDSHLFIGNPYLQTPVSEFRMPWTCMGSPTQEVRWLALTQWDGVPGFGTAGQVAGVFPEQTYDPVTTNGQFFPQFGTFNLVGEDLADGTLDDHLLIFRTYTGSGLPGAPNVYQINVKTLNTEGDYWDWGSFAPLIMTTNQDVTIDILRAKPVIENLIDVEYNEDSGEHTITLNDKASDYQDASNTLSWFVTDSPSNTHAYPTPYDYQLNGITGTAGGLAEASLTIDTLDNQFGGHRLYLTVVDSHGMTASQSMNVGIWNVNDEPVIWNSNQFDGSLVLYDGGGGNLNVHDENFNGIITKSLGDSANVSSSYILDMANEQSQSDWNTESIPQVYSWAADEGDCRPFSTSVANNIIEISENITNEAGGDCDIVLSLDDGASQNSDANDVTVNFIVNPVNDAPVVKEFDAANNVYVETANGSLQLDWFWDVVEDDENANNLTFDLHRLMDDNDHWDRNDGSGMDELTWSVEETPLCAYENYFSVTVDNAADTLALSLIPDAATNAPTSEIDYLQDADGDGASDGGIHQIQPASGVYCTVYLWLNDTADAPTHIDYAQHSSGQYEQRTVRETVYIRVMNTPEARPDWHFDDEVGYNWLNVEAVLPGTRVPVEIDIVNDGNDPALYNYEHDVQVRFYVNDNPTLMQDQITVEWDDLPAVGESETIRGYVTLNNPSEYVRTFIEVRTINPLTGEYIDSSIRRPALEELNWNNNNLTTQETSDDLPQMVRLRGAITSVTGFAPGLLAVSLVGAFVGALLMQSRKEEDGEEFEALASDDEAVSPVIATILLVAITVVLSGVIYVWAQSLASDSVGKAATPRMTFDQDARFGSELGGQDNWYWKVAVLDGDELATQAVFVKVQWLNSTGVAQTHTTSLANPAGVYGFVPSNSDQLVTFKDSINCNVDCSTGFGANDFIQIRMTDPANGNEVIEDATIILSYNPAGGNSYTLMTWTASFNPPSISPQF